MVRRRLLTPVGLLPVAAGGGDIAALLDGAREAEGGEVGGGHRGPDRVEVDAGALPSAVAESRAGPGPSEVPET